ELRSCGLGRDQVVGICLERSLEMVVGLLAILKAGAAYLPLDPSYPAERLEYMLEDAAPRVLLTTQKLKKLLPIKAARTIALDELLEQTAGGVGGGSEGSEHEGSEHEDAGSLVYVIYTSGSTGRPKAVAMPHRSMVSLIEWHRKNLPCSPGKRVLQF